jgi:hypothetical protein
MNPEMNSMARAEPGPFGRVYRPSPLRVVVPRPRLNFATSALAITTFFWFREHVGDVFGLVYLRRTSAVSREEEWQGAPTYRIFINKLPAFMATLGSGF